MGVKKLSRLEALQTLGIREGEFIQFRDYVVGYIGPGGIFLCWSFPHSSMCGFHMGKWDLVTKGFVTEFDCRGEPYDDHAIALASISPEAMGL